MDYIYREKRIMELKFVLISPAVSGNIGSAARAIKTMGFTDLWLVQACDHLDGEAYKMAHGARDVLEAARVFPGFGAMTEELDLIVGTTAKTRNVQGDYLPAGQLRQNLLEKGSSAGTTGILFGPEESGLTNEELAACNLVSRVPMAASYPSLNLSQAVMLFAYELSAFSKIEPENKSVPLDVQSFRIVLDRSREVLESTELSKNPQVISRIMQRLALLGEEDIHLVHSVTTRLLAKLKNKSA